MKHTRRQSAFTRAAALPAACGAFALASACSWPIADTPSPLAASAVGAVKFPDECFAPSSAPPSDAAGAPGDAAGAAGEGGRVVNTHLYSLQTRVLEVGAQIGAVEALCEDLVVATKWGRMLIVRPTGTVRRLGGDIPMNIAAFERHPALNEVRHHRFRVHDILLQARGSGRWRVFATHHYYTGTCIRFRLSVTTMLRQDGDVSISPDWRTVFDAEPCLPTNYDAGQMAGGKMVADGPAHLFVAIGDHGMEGSDDEWPRLGATYEPIVSQAPHSHLGKLLRVEIETGRTDTLALGLRNPQGLAADPNGNLWETEHGPQGGDEINLMRRGANYGWPFVNYGIGYGGTVIGRDTDAALRHEGYVKPVFAWVPSIATTAVVVNDASSFPLWSDDLLVASLTGSLYRVRHHGGIARYVEQLDVDIPRLRDLTQTSDGRLALAGILDITTLKPRAKGCDGGWHLVRRIYSFPCDDRADRPDADASASDA